MPKQWFVCQKVRHLASNTSTVSTKTFKSASLASVVIVWCFPRTCFIREIVTHPYTNWYNLILYKYLQRVTHFLITFFFFESRTFCWEIQFLFKWATFCSQVIMTHVLFSIDTLFFSSDVFFFLSDPHVVSSDATCFSQVMHLVFFMRHTFFQSARIFVRSGEGLHYN